MKKYVVRLSADERTELTAMIKQGKRAAAVVRHAHILLKADQGPQGPGWRDEEIAEALEIGASSVQRVRQTLVEHGLEEALKRKRPTNRQYRKLDGKQEAQLSKLACSHPPPGHARWTLQLLADQLVELKIVDTISRECVRATLKKTRSSRGKNANG